MSGFRCLALETGTPTPTVAARNGNREFELAPPGGRKGLPAPCSTPSTRCWKTWVFPCRAWIASPSGRVPARLPASGSPHRRRRDWPPVGGLRLCPVSSLAALAQDALDRLDTPGGVGGLFAAPVLSAGRGEVYSGWYQADDSVACGAPSPKTGSHARRICAFRATRASWRRAAPGKSALQRSPRNDHGSWPRRLLRGLVR